MDTFNHSLPAQLTSFIGRAQEIAKAGALFGSARILTFIGPGVNLLLTAHEYWTKQRSVK